MACLVIFTIFGSLFLFMTVMFVSMGFSTPVAFLFTTALCVALWVNDGTTKQKKSSNSAQQIVPENKKAKASYQSQSLQPRKIHAELILQDFGEYREPLKSGGYLSVRAEQWSILYFLHGPGGRFDRTLLDIPGKNINTYCRAFRSNFKEYCKYRSIIPSTSSLVKHGEMDMAIRVNTGSDGVFLREGDMCINTEDQLLEIISEYKKAELRAKEIQYLFGNPNSKQELQHKLVDLLQGMLSRRNQLV